MNILLINHYAGSPDMGMEFRPYYFAREWIKMGHKVDIIAADYSHLRRKNPVVTEDFQKEDIDGITYHWIKTNQYEGNGAKRAMTMAKFVSKLWLHSKRIVKELEPDVVICSSTYPLDTFVGQRIKKKSRKKVKLIHEVHDMWPATLTEIGGMSKYHPFVVAMQLGENSAYKHSDYVVSLVPYAETYMKGHGLKNDKFACIPNGVVKDEWEEPLSLPEEHKKILDNLHQEEKFIVGYFGGHALSNALDNLLNVAQNINDSDISFVLVGDGVEKERLVCRSKSLGLKNIIFLDSITKRAIPSLCREFDCVYMGSLESPLYRFGVCLNKMFDSMMSGKPIICSITTPKTYIEEYECGIKVDSGDIDRCIEAIKKIKGLSEAEKENMGNNGKYAVLKEFNYESLAIKFERLMEEESEHENINCSRSASAVY